MGIGALGFISGAASTGLDMIQKRQEAETETKKSIFAEQLRRETQKYLMDYELEVGKTQVDKNMTDIDYSKGVKTLRNSRGESLGEVPLSQSDIEDHSLESRSKTADTSYKEGQAKYVGAKAEADIAQSRASADAARASAANSYASASETKRAGSRALDGSGGGDGISDVGKEMRYRYKDTADSLVKGGVPSEAIDAAAMRLASEAKKQGWTKSYTERTYLDVLSKMRTKFGADTTRKPLDSIGSDGV